MDLENEPARWDIGDPAIPRRRRSVFLIEALDVSVVAGPEHCAPLFVQGRRSAGDHFTQPGKAGNVGGGAAIDNQHLAGDVAGLVGGKEGHGDV
jgi:hypothetical protein